MVSIDLDVRASPCNKTTQSAASATHTANISVTVNAIRRMDSLPVIIGETGRMKLPVMQAAQYQQRQNRAEERHAHVRLRIP